MISMTSYNDIVIFFSPDTRHC